MSPPAGPASGSVAQQPAAAEARKLLQRLGCAGVLGSEGLPARTPITGETVGLVPVASRQTTIEAVGRAVAAFRVWRDVPAPRRGELVRLLGETLREAKAALGALVTLEAGKIASEGLGEVQEMIDICDFAVGLSRQLYGRTIASERAGHRMMETWHPLGAGGRHHGLQLPRRGLGLERRAGARLRRPVIWKPSEKTPLTALAVAALLGRAAERFGDCAGRPLPGADRRPRRRRGAGRRPAGAARLGDRLDGHGPGRRPATRRALRPLAARARRQQRGDRRAERRPRPRRPRAIAFAAVGTAGQRCTTLRRLIVHESVADALRAAARAALCAR